VKLLMYYAIVFNISTCISIDQVNLESLTLVQAYPTVTHTKVTSLWAQSACNDNHMNTCSLYQHFILNHVDAALCICRVTKQWKCRGF
jgi:hypothetical protein